MERFDLLLSLLKASLKKNGNKPITISHLINMIDENSDSITADVILQTVFFENVIFG